MTLCKIKASVNVRLAHTLTLPNASPSLNTLDEREYNSIHGDFYYWTSADISAGIDLALAFIADQTDEETAGEVQFFTEYYPAGKRYGQRHLQADAPAYLKDSV